MTIGPLTVIRPGAAAVVGVVGPIGPLGPVGPKGSDGNPGGIGPQGLQGVPGPLPIQPITAWTANAAFIVGPPASYVSVGQSSYICVVAHTSSSSFANDFTAGYWRVSAGQGGTGPTSLTPVSAWITSAAYTIGPPASYVSINGSSYQCLVNHTSGTFATDLAAGKWGVVASVGAQGAQGNPGANGTGSGTVIGPSTSTAGHVATYKDSGGQNLADAGIPAGAELLPVQTSTGASYPFSASDLFKETRRSNGGAAMADTLPPASTAGLVNGTTIQINNADAVATLTLSPGSGTTMITAAGTVASVAIGPTRATRWIYDLANTAWRPTGNSLTAALLSQVLTRGQVVALALGAPF